MINSTNSKTLLQDYTSYKVLIVVLLGISTNNLEEILSLNKVMAREPCLRKIPVSHSIRMLLKIVDIENVQYSRGVYSVL